MRRETKAPGVGPLLAHSLALDELRLTAIAASLAGDGEGHVWAQAELARWALDGRKFQSMVANDSGEHNPELVQALEQAAEHYRRERRRSRAVNLALGALASAVVLLLAMVLGFGRGSEVLAGEAFEATQALHLEELRRQQLELNSRLDSIESNNLQMQEWFADALLKIRDEQRKGPR